MTENKKIIGKINIDLIKGEFTPKFYLIDEGERMTEKKERFFIHKDMVSDTEMKIPITLWQNKEQQKKFCDELNKLNDENEQLKAQLKKGEDVCDICKYQYLTKRDTDKYYIAKCKKEHFECSKGTVNYCEDFDLKGDIE